LDKEVDQKYFLSPKAVKAILDTSGELLVLGNSGSKMGSQIAGTSLKGKECIAQVE